MFQVVADATKRWGLTFRRETAKEYSAPCPFCGGDDRFRLFENGGFWCRQCNTKGWVDDNQPRPDPTELERRRREAWEREMERRLEEHDRRLSALERMARCTDHVAYHRALIDNEAAWEYWLSEGMKPDTIARYQLGYCARCPTAGNGSPSYTIPVINGGTLENIRHRLVNPDGGKYRPHIAGLGTQLFNRDNAERARSSIVITEGEKKSMVLDQTGIRSVGILGSRNFKTSWFDLLKQDTIYVALDPDAEEHAYRLAALFDGRGRVVSLPFKADDMIVKHEATKDDMLHFIRLAKPVEGRAL